MYNTKFKRIFIIILFLEIQAGCGMPQGFFSQRFSIPKIVSWNNNERSLTILPNIRVESPVKNSLINVFGKKDTTDNFTNVPKKEEQTVNIGKIGQNNGDFSSVDYGSGITNQEKKTDQSNTNVQNIKLPTDLKGKDQLISKFNFIDENATDNQIGDTDITTETIIETTTDDYETTTFDYEPLNRASPQLVASLLG